MTKFNNTSEEIKITDELNDTQKEEMQITDKTTDIITARHGYGIFNKRYTITPPIKNKAYTELIEKIKDTSLKEKMINEPNKEAKITF